MGDGELEDWAKEGFLIASVVKAIEKCIDLSVDYLGFGVEPMKAVNHSEDEAT